MTNAEYAAAIRSQLARYQVELYDLEQGLSKVASDELAADHFESRIRQVKTEMRDLEFRLTDLLIAEVQ